jgi:tRNA threonylcarbamoyl adenosine modification protein (Sua5/YciO/YrdC/YwlC family)
MTSVPVEEPEELADEQVEQDEVDDADEGSDGLVTGASAPSSTGEEATGAGAPSSTGGDGEDEPTGAQRLGTDGDDAREEALSAASMAVQRGELVVLPTDTVYGIGADAFDAKAVQALLDAKGRGREMPPPVLISAATTLDALATGIPEYARRLVDRFWPGPLTIVCNQQRSLQWDLGETRGTVGIRMPDHRLARDLLERTGPMAVSSANLTGHPAATDADQAEEMLGQVVAVIIDDGTSPGGAASTIVDVRGANGKVLRTGALSVEELNEALDDLDARILDEDEDEDEEAAPGA